MYEPRFGFRDRPFAAEPLTNRYFPAPSMETARQSLVRTIERSNGPGLIVGAAGTGKTLLCNLLAEQFRDQFWVATLSSARLCSRRALLQNILFELKLPFRQLEEGELRLSLIDHLEPGPQCPGGMLLIVDEAHTLPLPLLEEIRMITNLVRAGQSRVRLVLAGNASLEEKFAHPKLASFSQRIGARCYLGGMTPEETRDYLLYQIAGVGGDGDSLLDDSAIDAVFRATDGVPRLVNQLCDHALMLAAVAGNDRLNSDSIEEAWGDLQQLPTRVGPAAGDFGDSEVIEFGSLDEEFADVSAEMEQPGESADELDPVDEQVDVPVDEFEDRAGAERAELEVVASESEPIEREASETLADEADERSSRQAVVLEFSSDLIQDAVVGSVQRKAADEFVPPLGRTEVDLTFDDSSRLFGSTYEQEEAVVDRYASLEDEVLRVQNRVSSEEGRDIAAALGFAEPPPVRTTASTPAVTGQESSAATPPSPAAATESDALIVGAGASFDSLPDAAQDLSGQSWQVQLDTTHGNLQADDVLEQISEVRRVSQEGLRDQPEEHSAAAASGEAAPGDPVSGKPASGDPASSNPVSSNAQPSLANHQVELQVFDPTSDAVAGEPVARSDFDLLSARAASLAGTRSDDQFAGMANDDRELLLPETETVAITKTEASAQPEEAIPSADGPAEAPAAGDHAPAANAPRGKRREYRQLFAGLRQG